MLSFRSAARSTGRMGLRARATVAAAVLALATTTALSLMAYGLVRSYLLNQRDSFTSRQAFTNARVVRDVLRGPAPDVTALLGSLRSDPGAYPLLRLSNEWFGSAVGAGEDTLPGDLRRAVDAGQSAHQRFRNSGESFQAVAVALPDTDAVYVEVFSLDELERTLSVLSSSLIGGAVLTTLGAAAVGHWSSRRVLQPVARVADAAEALATGGLDTRLPPERDPDLQRLVGSFNGMADAIQARIEREARFASDVSHELRSPLAALAAASEVLGRRREEFAGPARQALDIMLNQISRFSTMVLDLLEISRIDAGMADVNLEPAPLAELTAKVVAGSEHRDVIVDVAPSVATAIVRLDRRRYERLMSNLLDNAERYGEAPIHVRIARERGRVAVHVDDSGPGVPAAERDHIFERFARGSTAQQASGTGLGLALVREHARLHDATVAVTDSPNGGARFTLSFPFASAAVIER